MSTEEIKEHQSEEPQPVDELEALELENQRIREEIEKERLERVRQEEIARRKEENEKLLRELKHMKGPDGDEEEKKGDDKSKGILHASDEYLPPTEAVNHRKSVYGFPEDKKLIMRFYERQVDEKFRGRGNTAYRLREITSATLQMVEASKKLEDEEFSTNPLHYPAGVSHYHGNSGVRNRNWDLFRRAQKQIQAHSQILKVVPLFKEVDIPERTKQRYGIEV